MLVVIRVAGEPVALLVDSIGSVVDVDVDQFELAAGHPVRRISGSAARCLQARGPAAARARRRPRRRGLTTNLPKEDPMKSRITWTVGRRLAAITAIGGVDGRRRRRRRGQRPEHAEHRGRERRAADYDGRGLAHARSSTPAPASSRSTASRRVAYQDNSDDPGRRRRRQREGRRPDGPARRRSTWTSSRATKAQFEEAWDDVRRQRSPTSWTRRSPTSAAVMQPRRRDPGRQRRDGRRPLRGHRRRSRRRPPRNAENFDHTRSDVRTLVLVASAIGLIALVALAFLIARSITRPLRDSASTCSRPSPAATSPSAPRRRSSRRAR